MRKVKVRDVTSLTDPNGKEVAGFTDFIYDGYFHKWVNKNQHIFGIIESENGLVALVAYTNIKFIRG